jgi:hypothetical protein
MGAVFASAARAPLTSLASVVEMTGDFALTLPVMLAVAIAATISRALSYGTIYTTKLLRRGTDIDRTTPWRALTDLTVADAMRPFRPTLPVPPDTNGSAEPDWAALAGPVSYQGDPQALFGTESLAQALHARRDHAGPGDGRLGTCRPAIAAAASAHAAIRLPARRDHCHLRFVRDRTEAEGHHLAARQHSAVGPARPPAPAAPSRARPDARGSRQPADLGG